MKTIKNISVECSFRVAFSNVEVPDDVYEQLENNQEFTCDDSKKCRSDGMASGQYIPEGCIRLGI